MNRRIWVCERCGDTEPVDEDPHAEGCELGDKEKCIACGEGFATVVEAPPEDSLSKTFWLRFTEDKVDPDGKRQFELSWIDDQVPRGLRGQYYRADPYETKARIESRGGVVHMLGLVPYGRGDEVMFLTNGKSRKWVLGSVVYCSENSVTVERNGLRYVLPLERVRPRRKVLIDGKEVGEDGDEAAAQP